MRNRPPHALTFFFFNDTATTEIYTLSLHDALPICGSSRSRRASGTARGLDPFLLSQCHLDRKSTRLNSSHSSISYAVFCLKKHFSVIQSKAGSRIGRIFRNCRGLCVTLLAHKYVHFETIFSISRKRFRLAFFIFNKRRTTYCGNTSSPSADLLP